MQNRLFGGSIHAALTHAATQFDARAESLAAKTGRYHNPYALAHYFKAIERVETAINNGMSPRKAVIGCFNGRLRDCMLKAINEPKATLEEIKEADSASFRALFG